MPFRSLFLLFAALTVPLGTVKALNWDELMDGDLSNLGDDPTFITFTEGSNLIEGTMGALGGEGDMDADVWSFTIAAGYYLTGINLFSYSAPTSGHNSFMAIARGGEINMTETTLHLSNGLWTEELDSEGHTYTDLMDILDTQGPMFGGDGFDGPLGPGTYTFWIQEGSEQISYGIDFVVTAAPVPEPGSLWLLGLAGLLTLRRRR